MSLATRCTHCGTIFKIVEDQLKVSEGWVRCGRCNEVFNAMPTLFDMAHEAPPPRRPAPVAPAAPPAPPAPVTPSPATTAATSAATSATTPTAPNSAAEASVDEPSPLSTQRPRAYAPAPDFSATLPIEPEPASEKLTADTLPTEIPIPVRAATDFELDTRLPAEEMQWARRPFVKPETEAATAEAGHEAQPEATQTPAAPEATQQPEPAPTAALDSIAAPVEPAISPVAATPAAIAPAPVSPIAPPPLPPEDLPRTDEADALDSRYLMPSEERATSHRRKRGPEFADAEFPTDALQDAEAEWAESQLASDDQRIDPSLGPTADPDALASSAAKAPTPMPTPSGLAEGKHARLSERKRDTSTPSFIRKAQKQAFWRQPSVRGVLTGLFLALCVSLVAQVIHHFRDTLAAHDPNLRPALELWCRMANCTLKPPLRIEDLQVDNATLLRSSANGPDRYVFTVVIRNRSKMALNWPHVDLSLTDNAGNLIARRSFSPNDAQWHSGSEPDTPTEKRPDAVPPRQSSTMIWQMHAPGLQPAGYTAELFYP